MIFGIGGIIKAVVALIIVVTVAAGGWYITGLRADLAVREANEKQLRAGIEEQQRLMDRMRADVAAIQKINQELNTTVRRQAEEVTTLTRKFSQDSQGNARDFGEFAKEKPGLVERLVNRGTANAYRCMELASGAPHTAEELAATTRDAINRECPAIANPNYKGGGLDAVVKSASRAETTKPVEAVAVPESKPAPATLPRTPPPPVRPPPPGAKK